MGNTDNYIQIMTDSLIMKKSVLEKGVGHLFGSSLPVGGKNVNGK